MTNDNPKGQMESLSLEAQPINTGQARSQKTIKIIIALLWLALALPAGTILLAKNEGLSTLITESILTWDNDDDSHSDKTANDKDPDTQAAESKKTNTSEENSGKESLKKIVTFLGTLLITTGLAFPVAVIAQSIDASFELSPPTPSEKGNDFRILSALPAITIVISIAVPVSVTIPSGNNTSQINRIAADIEKIRKALPTSTDYVDQIEDINKFFTEEVQNRLKNVPTQTTLDESLNENRKTFESQLASRDQSIRKILLEQISLITSGANAATDISKKLTTEWTSLNDSVNMTNQLESLLKKARDQYQHCLAKNLKYLVIVSPSDRQDCYDKAYASVDKLIALLGDRSDSTIFAEKESSKTDSDGTRAM